MKQFSATPLPRNPWTIIRTISFLFLLCLLLPNRAKATTGTYTFASSSGTYTPLTGGTTLVSGATWDDSASALLTLPFTFTYNNSAYTSLGISSNGFITLGAVPSATLYCGLQSSLPNSIAGYGTDLVGASATSSVSYGVMGASPNRKYVIQWAEAKHYGTTGDSYTFQIILNETTNTVQVVWGPVTAATTMGANACADASTESGNIGLLGNSTQDFNIRSITNGSSTWASSTAGTAITAVGNMSATNFPASGLTYTWTPPIATAMSFTSCTTAFLNNAQGVSRGATNNTVIQVQVVVSGTLTPFSVTNLALSTNGSTNPTADISNAKVFLLVAVTCFRPLRNLGLRL